MFDNVRVREGFRPFVLWLVSDSSLRVQWPVGAINCSQRLWLSSSCLLCRTSLKKETGKAFYKKWVGDEVFQVKGIVQNARLYGGPALLPQHGTAKHLWFELLHGQILWREGRSNGLVRPHSKKRKHVLSKCLFWHVVMMSFYDLNMASFSQAMEFLKISFWQLDWHNLSRRNMKSFFVSPESKPMKITEHGAGLAVCTELVSAESTEFGWV